MSLKSSGYSVDVRLDIKDKVLVIDRPGYIESQSIDVNTYHGYIGSSAEPNPLLRSKKAFIEAMICFSESPEFQAITEKDIMTCFKIQVAASVNLSMPNCY
jgi:hypothetical protein